MRGMRLIENADFSHYYLRLTRAVGRSCSSTEIHKCNEACKAGRRLSAQTTPHLLAAQLQPCAEGTGNRRCIITIRIRSLGKRSKVAWPDRLNRIAAPMRVCSVHSSRSPSSSPSICILVQHILPKLFRFIPSLGRVWTVIHKLNTRPNCNTYVQHIHSDGQHWTVR